MKPKRPIDAAFLAEFPPKNTDPAKSCHGCMHRCMDMDSIYCAAPAVTARYPYGLSFYSGPVDECVRTVDGVRVHTQWEKDVR